MLVKKKILKRRNSSTYQVFTKHITSDFMNDPDLPLTLTPSEYVTRCWNKYQRSPEGNNNSLNGSIFEVIIETLLCRCNISPFYRQAKSEFIPDVEYDIVMYDEENKVPITISLKTTSRERYKQAALEAYAFKIVYRSSLNYLILNDESECENVQKKIETGAVFGLQRAIFARSDEFNEFISELANKKYGEAPIIKMFEGIEV